MNETRTTRALLDVEDACPDLLFERVPGSDAYLWPLARWPIAAALSAQHLKVVPVPAKRPEGLENLRLRAARRLPNHFASDRLDSRVDHLFIVSGTTRAPMPRRTGNWLTDAFAQSLADQAAVVQDAPLHALTPRSERPANSRTWTFEPALTRILRETQLNPVTPEQHGQLSRTLRAMMNPFSGFLPDEVQQRVVEQVIRRVHRVKYAESEFSDLLDRTDPRRIYMQTAAYGDRSNFIRLAHTRGIEVIELQHGWIGASHTAYNFGRAMRDTELTSSLPDALFTFGEYWGEHLRFPGRLAPVGKPILEQSVRSAAPFATRPQRLLLVSSVYEREKLTAAALALRRLLPASWQVAIRPHPSERATATELFAESLGVGVVLDEESEVSASIAGSRAVVGMISTVLYEALPLGTHIGVIDTDLSPHYSDTSIFPRRLNDEGSFASFTDSIQRDDVPVTDLTAYVWRPNAVDNFTSLVT